MISTRAEKVTELLDRYGQYREELKLNDQLRNRADDMEKMVHELDEPSKKIALQRERGWLKDSQLPTAEVEKLLAVIVKLRGLLADDPGKLGPAVNRLAKGCGNVVEKVSDATKVGWDEVVKRRQPPVDEADLKRCEPFNSEEDKVNEIRRLSRISVSRVPSDLDALHEIEKRWDRLRELIGSLPKGSDNPDVNRFLDAVRKGGAPLALLTDVVRQYLDDEGKTDAFRIYQER